MLWLVLTRVLEQHISSAFVLPFPLAHQELRSKLCMSLQCLRHPEHLESSESLAKDVCCPWRSTGHVLTSWQTFSFHVVLVGFFYNLTPFSELFFNLLLTISCFTYLE